MLLSASHYAVVPSVINTWDSFFEWVTPEIQDGFAVLDFSKPGLHRYQNSGVSLWAPGLAEEDAMDAYTASYHPQAGDVVWDVGAHAGATSYFFAQMVGSTGKVYAFEPDELSHAYLLRNIELHNLNNVVPIKKALAGKTGTAAFSMDGTVGAGLVGLTQCTNKQNVREVETLSFEDASSELGVPTLVKMDVEGAEVEVIASALDVLRKHPIHLAIETEHRIHREYTSEPITRMLSGIGYRTRSALFSGMRFTWAEPS